MGETLQLNSTGMQCIGAYRTLPVARPKAGIVVVQEIFGVNEHIRGVVDCFARHGYVAIAPALFDHLETGVELDYDDAGVARGRALIEELGIDRALADVGSAADSIRSAGRIGVVGYCWGGTIAMLAAMRLGLPAVSYYGARNVRYLDEPASAALQFHFGANDSSIPAAAVQRHRDLLPDAEIHVYPAGHGFNCERRKDYHGPSAVLALQRTLDFFERTIATP